jgi:predicted Fe-Mo cluster-binding NifX family protein
MKRIAIPVVKSRLSEYFGQCDHYKIFEIDGSNIKNEKIKNPPKDDLVGLPEWAANEGITDIITYKVDKRIINLFSQVRINLYVGIPINIPPRKLIKDYIRGKLISDEKIIAEIMAGKEN